MAKLRYNLYIINSIHFKVLNDLNYFSDFQQIDRFVQPSLPSSFLIFPSPRKLPMPDSGLSNSHAEPQETASLLSVSADSPALDVSRNGIMRCVAFYIWPLSVGVTFLALLCVVARGSIWFPFTAEQCSTLWTGHIRAHFLQYTLLASSRHSFHPPAS